MGLFRCALFGYCSLDSPRRTPATLTRITSITLRLANERRQPFFGSRQDYWITNGLSTRYRFPGRLRRLKAQFQLAI